MAMSVEEAFEVVVRLSPGMSKAHEWLQVIYSDHLNNQEKAAEHQDFIDQNIYENTHFGNLPTLSEFQATLNNLQEGVVLQQLAS